MMVGDWIYWLKQISKKAAIKNNFFYILILLFIKKTPKNVMRQQMHKLSAIRMKLEKILF